MRMPLLSLRMQLKRQPNNQTPICVIYIAGSQEEPAIFVIGPIRPMGLMGLMGPISLMRLIRQISLMGLICLRLGLGGSVLLYDGVQLLEVFGVVGRKDAATVRIVERCGGQVAQDASCLFEDK